MNIQRRLQLPLLALTLSFLVGLVGCASSESHQSKFTATTITAIKAGMTKSEVTALVGEPRSRSLDNDGNEVWQYRKNAQQGKGAKTFSDVMSFGMTSDIDAPYQDILSVIFAKDIVVKATYEENVHTPNALNPN